MKYLFICLSLLSILGFQSCKKDKFTDALYITGTEVNPINILTVDDGIPSSLGISVTASNQVSANITASLNTAPELVESYNKINGKKYQPLPSGTYSLSTNEVSISPGSNVSTAVKFTVTSTAAFKTGVTYMMPVTITNSTGELKVLESSRTVYIIVKPVIRSTVASLTGGNYFTPNFSAANSARLTNMSTVTIEGRILVNKFQSSSPYISSIMGIEEHFLLRFGDVTIKPNQLQRAGMVALTAPQEFATGVWYHIALVHDVSITKLYVNGVMVASTADSNNINILQPLGSGAYSTGFLIGTSAGGRYFDGLISEFRFWSKALTPSEIIDGMCGVDPTSNGLEAYWKFNEGQGKVVTDITGHGHNATARSTVTWVPNVRCDQ